MSFWPRLYGLAGCLVLLASGCMVEPVSPEDTEVTGGVELTLTARGSRGNVYRLSLATFLATGPTQILLGSGSDDENLMASLPVGTYSVELLSGWQLVRVADNVPVEADVRDDSLEGVLVQQGATTSVHFAFDLATGEEVGFGSLEIGIDVNEGEEPLADADGDGVVDTNDNCPTVYNYDQSDLDADRVGDSCDICPFVANANQDPSACAFRDYDLDFVPDHEDNCPSVANASQIDSDWDGIGDACEFDAGDVPQPELCDGLDNDLDGEVDEECQITCVPSNEICDGIDNDCDAVIDEGCAPPNGF